MIHNNEIENKNVFCKNCGEKPISLGKKCCSSYGETDFIPSEEKLKEWMNTPSVLIVCRACRHDMYYKPSYDEEKSCKYCAEPDLIKSY